VGGHIANNVYGHYHKTEGIFWWAVGVDPTRGWR